MSIGDTWAECKCEKCDQTYCVSVPALFKCKIIVEAKSIEQAKQKIIDGYYEDMIDLDFDSFLEDCSENPWIWNEGECNEP